MWTGKGKYQVPSQPPSPPSSSPLHALFTWSNRTLLQNCSNSPLSNIQATNSQRHSRSARIHGRDEKSRGRKRANKPHDIMCPRRRRDASLSRRVPKPVDFPFERFPKSDDITERNGRLTGRLSNWPDSKLRTRGTLATAVTVRYTVSATRVSCFNLIADRLRRRLRNQIRRRANFGAEGLLSQFSRQAGITSARKIANAVAVADGGPVNAQTRYLPVHA
ncbi:hypothetical protein G5I_05912 [Acromyrmex echinatior]|uniref:Uncharacterized protein n=1 Tax=Acromyrmex echinatior TaxID=103372 RepID=F4WJN1_ACREC|nr:hypothetical protein G5I_05912 [Acromyrmex echinatior]